MREFKDNFEKFFEDPNEMLDVAQNFKTNSEWLKVANNSLSFNYVDAENASDFKTINPDVIMDTVENTGLVMNLGESMALPVRTCAVPSILRRAGFNCEVAGKINRRRLAELLTEFMPVNGGLSIIHKSFDKASFAGAGNNYAPMEPYDLMMTLYDEIESRFNDYSFVSGCMSHYLTAMKLSLPSAEEDVNKKYMGITSVNGMADRDLMPMIYFVTSELGDSAVHIVGKLLDSKSNVEIGIGSLFSVVHKGANTMQTFSKNCSQLYSKLLDCTENMERLFKTEIEFPVDCLKRVGKAIGLCKKDYDPYFCSVVDLYQNKWGNGFTNAGELYWTLGELLPILKINGFDEGSVLHVEEKIMTTLSPKFSWHSYDYKII